MTVTAAFSFIDLRAFAADQQAGLAAPAASDGAADAYFANRRLIALPEGAAAAGAIRLDASAGTVTDLPTDEFLIVAGGSIAIEQDGHMIRLNEGDSIVLARGSSFTWATAAQTDLLFMQCDGEASRPGALVPIDAAAARQPSGAPLAELLIGETPSCRNFTDYRSANGEFMCGTWDSTPYHRRAMTYRHHELMHLLDGSVTFADEKGDSATFEKDDIFLIPMNAQCSWESRVDVAKTYAIYRPA